MSAAQRLLDRLEDVKQTAPDRWLAKCPGHADRTASLSVRDVDGAVLVHDFAGCATRDVMQAVGLRMGDLYDRPIEHRPKPTKRQIPATDALEAIDHEAKVVAFIATDFLEHREIDEETWQRLAEAVSRIGAARSKCAPARFKP